MRVKWTDGNDTKLSLEAFQEGLSNNIEVDIDDNDFIYWEVDPKKITLEQREQVMDIVGNSIKRWMDNEETKAKAPRTGDHNYQALDMQLMDLPSRFFCDAMDEVLGNDWDENESFKGIKIEDWNNVRRFLTEKD